jgi:hypothetical protein
MADKNHTNGSEGKKKPSAIKIILYVVVGFIALGIIGNIINGDKKDDGNTKANSPVQEEKEITYTEVDMKSFVKEYDENDVTANKKYADTYIRTTGYIGEISEDIVGSVYVLVEPINDDLYLGTSVQCYVINDSEVDGLKEEKKITFQGRVDDFGIFNVVIKDCDIL